jgi:probable rRNA maturation factor
VTELEQPNDRASDADHGIEIQIDELYTTLVNPAALETAALATLTRCGAPPAALTIVITDDDAVQALNRDYRGIDAPTDVLSFAAHDASDAGMALVTPPELADELAAYLGDIIIALPYATRQAVHYGNSLDDELRLLTVHGVLHLLGHDHATPEDDDAMWQIQAAVLQDAGAAALVRRAYED